MSDFGPANAVGGAWECPDLFPLSVDGDPTKTKWVMVVNLNPGGIQGGSAGQYFVGDFDGKRFTADNIAGPYTPPAGELFAGFDGATYEGWTTTGNAFGDRPAPGTVPPQGAATGCTFAGTRPPAGTIGDQQLVSGYEGSQLVNTFFDHDNGTGHITSPEFTIGKDYINFLIGGGNHPWPGTATNRPTSVNLVVDGAVVRTATGKDSERLNWTNWNVADLRGKRARIDVVDENTGGWGHINVDQITFADAPAFPRSSETAVNLLVDGKVVRTATGPNSEALDWRAWSLRDLIGKTARIQIVDRNTGGWGHILADNFAFADAPAQSLLDRAAWLDYGKDYYAAISWNDAPRGKRLMIGWMNNWQYANAVPTSPWRSAMSVPREVDLRTVDGRVQLVQRPVASVDTLRTGQPHTESGSVTGERTLAKRGDVVDIRATFRPGTAARTGLKVLTSANGDETAIGYDATTGSVFVDRTKSGAAAAELPGFAGVHSAPVTLRDGRVNLRILVDRSLVEVFAQGGERVIADQVYPTPGADGIKVFADGGTSTLESLDISELRSTWGARSTETNGGVGGTVPATLSLTLGAPASFGAFQPGVTREYTAATTANVISTAGDAALTVVDPGHLVNGAFTLPEPLRVSMAPAAWTGPVSNAAVAIRFDQLVKATDALRTGTYSRTLTFTLSTTNP
jgi:levanase